MNEYLKGVIDGLFLGLLIVWVLFPLIKRYIVKRDKGDRQ